MATNRAVSAALHTPQLGGHAATGTQNLDPSPLSHPKKASIPPNWNMKHWKSVKLGDPLKFWLARGRILSLILPISARKPKKVARYTRG